MNVMEISAYIKSISREPVFDPSVFFQTCKSVQIDSNVLGILEKEYAGKEKEFTKNAVLFSPSKELSNEDIEISKEAQHFKGLVAKLEKDMADKGKMMANAQIHYEESKAEHDLMSDKLSLLNITLQDIVAKYKHAKGTLTLKRSKIQKRKSLKETIIFIKKQIENLQQSIVSVKEEYIIKVIISIY
jgi:hypothetical protein